MSVGSIINPTTGRIYDDLVPQGGGVPLTKGQLITADAGGTEQPFPVGTNGFVLSCNSAQPLGLEYIQLPAGGINFTQEGQLLYAGAGPAFADSLLNIGNAGQILGINAGIPAWQDAGGSGLITANAPLIEEADPAPNSKISINFSAGPAGQIPYGNGTAKTGALTNTPTAGQILGVAGGVPAWINAGGSGTITALAPLTEYAVGNASNVAIDFTAKGDLVVGAGPQVGGNPVAGVVLPVGANDYVLTANSATASGLEWKASGSGSSAIIFRNNQDNTPLIITAPLTANDTCVITADRVYDNFNSQIFNIANLGGLQTQTTGYVIFNWTPANSISITSIVANAKVSSTDPLEQTQTVVALTAYNDSTTIYSSSDYTYIGTADLYNYINFNNLPFEVNAGTTYSFYVLFTSQQLVDTYYFIDDPQDPLSYIGNITVQGVEYINGAVSTFTLTAPVKFRISNDLVGKTSATCESFSSQSFVASEDLQSWIATGGINGGVAFIP